MLDYAETLTWVRGRADRFKQEGGKQDCSVVIVTLQSLCSSATVRCQGVDFRSLPPLFPLPW